MLREAYNVVKIEGIVSEIDIMERSFVKDGRNVNALGGVIKVLVEQEINGEIQPREIPVHVFASRLTKSGSVNPAYTSIEDVKNNYISIAACGTKEGADKIRIAKAKIKMNTFKNQAGVLVNTPRITASFFAKAIGTFAPEATFTTEFMVSNIKTRVDKDGIEVEPKKLDITGIVPQYNGTVDEVYFTATNPNVINAIETYWEPGKSYKASGRVNFTSTTKEILEEVDFGEPRKKLVTVNMNELTITGGSQSPLESDFEFPLAEVKTAMAARAASIEAKKTEVKQKAPAPANSSVSASKGLDLGF